MTIDETAIAATRLTAEQKIRFLAKLAFELTIAARDTYVPGSEDIAAPKQIRAFNEIQHRVTACLYELLMGETADIWIWPNMLEFSEAGDCVLGATQACSRAFQATVPG